MADQSAASAGKCPVTGGMRKTGTIANQSWWPNQLNLKVLHQHSALSDPMDPDFDYAKEFKSLDLNALIKDLHALMTDSQDWWPCLAGRGRWTFRWLSPNVRLLIRPIV